MDMEIENNTNIPTDVVLDKLQQEEVEEIFDLESLILDGTDSLIPLKFEYPGTTKKVGVYIRPINTKEFTSATRNRDGTDLFTRVLSIALYDTNKKHYSKELISKFPAGLTLELYRKIAEISGIPTEQNRQVNEEMVDKLMGF